MSNAIREQSGTASVQPHCRSTRADVGPTVEAELQRLRVWWNAVHLGRRTALGDRVVLSQSRNGLDAVMATIDATRR